MKRSVVTSLMVLSSILLSCPPVLPLFGPFVWNFESVLSMPGWEGWEWEVPQGYTRRNPLMEPVFRENSPSYWIRPHNGYCPNLQESNFECDGAPSRRPLGGNYLDTSWPMGIEGSSYVSSAGERLQDGSTGQPEPSAPWGLVDETLEGVLWTPTFVLSCDPSAHVVSFLVSGTDDANAAGESSVEVRVQAGDGSWQIASMLPANSSTPVPAQVRPHGDDDMRAVTFDACDLIGNPLPDFSAARIARLRIADEDPSGHINVDHIVLGSTGNEQNVPGIVHASDVVWGLTDLHAHWLVNIDHGAVQPGSAAALYVHPTPGSEFYQTTTEMFWGWPTYPTAKTEFDASTPVLDRLRKALPKCDQNGHLKPEGTCFVDGCQASHAEERGEMIEVLLASMNEGDGDQNCVGGTADCSHGAFGADNDNFHMATRPFLDVIHQQMYWEWLRRAWLGGLRLLITDVVHSVALEALFMPEHEVTVAKLVVAPLPLPHPEVEKKKTVVQYSSDDRVSIERQVCATKQMLQRPEIAPWAKVVYTPDEARAAIGGGIEGGKLAVILGSELDDVSRIRGKEGDVDYLQQLGIRKVTPVHLIDNHMGGSAVATNVLNAYNDLLSYDDDPFNGGRTLEGGANLSLVLTLNPIDPVDLKSRDELRRLFDATASFVEDGHTIATDPPDENALDGSARPDTTQFALVGGFDRALFLEEGNGFSGLGEQDNLPDPAGSLGSLYSKSSFWKIEDGCEAISKNGVNRYQRRISPDPKERMASACILNQIALTASGDEYKQANVSDLGAMFRAAVDNKELVFGVQIGGDTHLSKAEFGYTQFMPPAATKGTKFNDGIVMNVGHRNQKALTEEGNAFVERLQQHGLLIDASHLGERTAYSFIGSDDEPDTGPLFAPLAWPSNQPQCKDDPCMPDCQIHAYPMLATHTGFRALQLDDEHTKQKNWSAERNLSRDQLQRVLCTGGVVGLGVAMGATSSLMRDPEFTQDALGTDVPDDCGGSSKSFSQQLEYATRVIEEMPDPGLLNHADETNRPQLPRRWQGGLGIGSDFNGFETREGPRYGALGCPFWWEDQLGGQDLGGKGDAKRDQERHDQDQKATGVVYAFRDADNNSKDDNVDESDRYEKETKNAAAGIGIEQQPPLDRYWVKSKLGKDLGGTDYLGLTINEMGLVNEALLPDFLQDMANGADQDFTSNKNYREKMRRLYMSAELTIRAWERSILECKRRFGNPATCDPNLVIDRDGSQCSVW